jgi:SEC-C motif-containing protein
MRSRYSAFVVGDVAYLRETWHPHTRPPQLELDLDRRWTGLEVTATSGGGVFDTEGTVEFEASYEDGRGPGVQHENSTFVRDNRRWFYVAGRT